MGCQRGAASWQEEGWLDRTPSGVHIGAFGIALKRDQLV